MQQGIEDGFLELYKVIRVSLDKYMNEGISELESMEILKLDPFTQIGTPIQIIKAFPCRTKTHSRKGRYYNEYVR